MAGETEIWLRAVVTKVSGYSADETGLDEDLQDAVGLDSLGRLEVLAAIEDRFDFFFEDSELINVSTLARMLGVIERKLSPRTGTAP